MIILNTKFLRNALIFLISSGIVFLASGLSFAQDEYPPLSYYEVIEQRNIFRPNGKDNLADNHSPQQEIISNESTSDQVDDIILTGIIKIRGQYKAILEKKSEQKGFYVVVDQIIDDYTVEDIQNDKVVLKRDNRFVTLKIKIPTNNKIRHNHAKKSRMYEESKLMNEEQLIAENSHTTHKTNIMQSIRTGIPNAKN
jgi:hypothetical protein